MSIPTSNPLDHKHPRWLLHTAALCSAIFYSCVFLAANICPHGLQEHGWPFVYMVREWRVPGGLTFVYGPWPLYSPPLVSFEPMWLVLNILCGIVLTCLAAAITLFWLRVCPRPLQFSLRILFGFAIVVACLLGLIKYFEPNQWNMIFVALIALLFARMFAYVVPIACLVVAAHWTVVRSAKSQRRCRWAGIHWLTWLTVAFVAGTVMHYSVFMSDWGQRYGWPLTYQAQSDRDCWHASEFLSALFPMGFLKATALIADLLVWLMIVAATGFVVERWVRQIEQGIPTRLAALFLAGTVLFGGIICTSELTLPCWPEWYDFPFWLFGIACTIFAVELAPLHLLRAALQEIPRMENG